MEINQIRYVYYVAKYRNFSLAAEHLFVTQPTLSQQVRRLEDELGFRLFKRSTRTVTLTSEGEAFVKRAKPLLKMYDDLADEMAALKKENGRMLTVGLMPTFMDFDIQAGIQNFREQNEDISLICEVHPSGELIGLLTTRKFDSVIVYITPLQLDSLKRDMHAHILAADHVNVVLHKRNPLASREALTLDDLQGQTIFMREKPSAPERIIQLMFQQNGIVPKRVKGGGDFRSMLASVALDQGVCFHSSGVGEEYIHDPLVSLPLVPEINMLTTLLYMSDSPNTPLIEQFCRAIQASEIGTAEK